MTYESALEKIHSLLTFGSRPGLDRMRLLLKELGDPDTEALADLCSYGKTRTIGSFKVLDHEAILDIYRNANR